MYCNDSEGGDIQEKTGEKSFSVSAHEWSLKHIIYSLFIADQMQSYIKNKCFFANQCFKQSTMVTQLCNMIYFFTNVVKL